MITVVGAGLAGLAAALALVDGGAAVQLIEAGPAAGGRCRSYLDRELGCRIDNGNHLLLSGNDAAHTFLRRVGAADTLAGPGTAVFPFMDLATGQRWALRPGAGRMPWWVFDRTRRVAGTQAADYLALLGWLRVPPGATVAQVARPGPLYRNLIEPLAISALNTLPEAGDASLMAAVMMGSLARGGAACIPSYPREGLSESFVQPALTALGQAGVAVQFARRVTAIDVADGRASAIQTTDGPIPLDGQDAVVLAVPAQVAGGLLAGLTVPDAFEAILNVHFRIQADPGIAGFVGLVGGLSEWVFMKDGVTSVTISAANRHADLPADTVAAQVWDEVRAACGLAGPIPPHRVVREKRATFAATPAQNARRPTVAQAGLANLALAGDWTATGLPATIEGALRSGNHAALHLMRHTGAPRNLTRAARLT